MELFLINTVLVIAIALFLDRIFGELKRAHPLVMFGELAKLCRDRLYIKTKTDNRQQLIRGSMAWCICVLPFVMLAGLIEYYFNDYLVLILSALVLYVAIGANSLAQHAMAVYTPLIQGDIAQARVALSMIVSRDTQTLNEQAIATATVETVIENTHDAVIAPIVWYLIFGLPGIVLFRLSNTLDAMWGYKNEEFLYFGRWAARVDDVLGWISARVTVLLFACFNIRALTAVFVLGRKWYSPNAGPVMAAGGAVLNVQLGGDAQYHGQLKSRPLLSEGESASAMHILESIKVMYRVTYLLFGILVLIGGVQWLY